MSNLPSSISHRLLEISKQENEDFTLVLSRYGTERLLARISTSPRCSNFVLKGASLFLVWFGHTFRTTRDVDLLGFGSSDIEDVAETFRDLCRIDTFSMDGLVFLPESVVGSRIKEDQHYEGVRIKLRALLARTRIDLQVDIGFGDAVTPAAQRIVFPTLLDGSSPILLAYPPYTAIAEKFLAMVSLDMINSRMKDFYDIDVLFQEMDLDPSILAQAIVNTFQRRGAEMITNCPTALTSRFSRDPGKIRQWDAFKRSNRLRHDPGNLEMVIQNLSKHFEPVFQKLGVTHG